MPLPAPANIAAKFLGYLLDKDEMPSADLIFIDGNHGGCGVWVGVFWGVGWGVLLFSRVCVRVQYMCAVCLVGVRDGWGRARERSVPTCERQCCILEYLLDDWGYPECSTYAHIQNWQVSSEVCHGNLVRTDINHSLTHVCVCTCPEYTYTCTDYDDVRADINHYFPFLSPGGIMFGDDFGWAGVKKAVYEFAGRHNLTVLSPGGRTWMMA